MQTRAYKRFMCHPRDGCGYQNKDTNMGLFDKIFGGGDPEAKAKKDAEKERRRQEEALEARKRADDLLEKALGNVADARSYDARSKAAISLVMSSHYDHGVLAWSAIAQDFPDEAGGALQQVGTCFHLKKDFRGALEAYAKAIRAGYDPDLISDSIDEATKSLQAMAS
jgi:tetratricopeptide (TPR) repeat protein